MEAADVSEAAIRAFERNYQALLRNESGLIPEDSIGPCDSLPELEDVSSESEEFDPSLLAKTVVIKLNGGLGNQYGPAEGEEPVAGQGRDDISRCHCAADYPSEGGDGSQGAFSADG